MQFNVKEWRKIYDKVQFLGQIIKDSNESLDDRGRPLPALYPISKDTRNSIEEEIKWLVIKSNTCLDAAEMRTKKPLWKYDKFDPTTWLSHETFRFMHLLNPKIKKCKVCYH